MKRVLLQERVITFYIDKTKWSGVLNASYIDRTVKNTNLNHSNKKKVRGALSTFFKRILTKFSDTGSEDKT